MDNPYLNKAEDITITTGTNLTHWHQDGKFQFITFRLADSLPQSKIIELKNLKIQFELNNPKPWNESIKLEYYRLIDPKEHSLLDDGYGSCALKNPKNRRIISDAIHYYDGERYEVIAFVIMPNHVHLLIRLLNETKIEKIVQSLKRHSARLINNEMGKTGPFWMEDYFDRMIRSHEHLNNCIEYIRENPKYIHIGEYELYINAQLVGD